MNNLAFADDTDLKDTDGQSLEETQGCRDPS